MPYCSIYQIKARQYNYYIWLWWYTQSNSRDLPYYIALRKYTVCMPMYVHYMYYCIYPTLKKELGNLIAKFCNNKSDSWDLLYSILFYVKKLQVFSRNAGYIWYWLQARIADFFNY